MANRILVPQAEVEPVPCSEVQSPNHWTTREFPVERILIHLAYCLLKVGLEFSDADFIGVVRIF